MGLGTRKIEWEDDSFGYINSEVSELNINPDVKREEFYFLERNSKVSRQIGPDEKCKYKDC